MMCRGSNSGCFEPRRGIVRAGRVVMACLCVPLAHASAQRFPDLGELPPTGHASRDPQQWQAELREQLAAGNLNVRFPERFAAMRDHWNAVLATGEPCDDFVIGELITELWTDHGDPDLNEANQDYLIGTIRRRAEKCGDGLSAESRRSLLPGLMQYLRAGGGRATPTAQAELATALDNLAAGDPDVLQTVERLLDDAAVWVETVPVAGVIRESVYREGVKHHGEVFWLRGYARSHDRSGLPDPLPECYQRAVEKLVGLLSAQGAPERAFSADLRDAVRDAMDECGDRAVQDDLCNRLLIVLHVMLIRKPAIAERDTAYIDRSLLRLAKVERRLRDDRHWNLWTQAVYALGETRMSAPLKRWVRGLLERENLPAGRRKALESIRVLVRATSATESP